jgi:cell division transport system ATP-binding protein
VVRAALAEELDAQRKAAASAPAPDAQTASAFTRPTEPGAQKADAVAPVPSDEGRRAPVEEQTPAAVGPRTHPIVLPQVDVAELGVADRLGLSDDDAEEVGPTS